jgi:hypothetical protein
LIAETTFSARTPAPASDAGSLVGVSMRNGFGMLKVCHESRLRRKPILTIQTDKRRPLRIGKRKNRGNH